VPLRVASGSDFVGDLTTSIVPHTIDCNRHVHDCYAVCALCHREAAVPSRLATGRCVRYQSRFISRQGAASTISRVSFLNCTQTPQISSRALLNCGPCCDGLKRDGLGASGGPRQTARATFGDFSEGGQIARRLEQRTFRRDRRPHASSFDRLRMTKLSMRAWPNAPHPEPVEGRGAIPSDRTLLQIVCPGRLGSVTGTILKVPEPTGVVSGIDSVTHCEANAAFGKPATTLSSRRTARPDAVFASRQPPLSLYPYALPNQRRERSTTDAMASYPASFRWTLSILAKSLLSRSGCWGSLVA